MIYPHFYRDVSQFFKGTYPSFLKALSPFLKGYIPVFRGLPIWAKQQEGAGYQDAPDRKILQTAVPGRVEDHREGFVGGLDVAELHLILEKGWRILGPSPALLQGRGPGQALLPPGSSGPGGPAAPGTRSAGTAPAQPALRQPPRTPHCRPRWGKTGKLGFGSGSGSGQGGSSQHTPADKDLEWRRCVGRHDPGSHAENHGVREDW